MPPCCMVQETILWWAFAFFVFSIFSMLKFVLGWLSRRVLAIFSILTRVLGGIDPCFFLFLIDMGRWRSPEVAPGPTTGRFFNDGQSMISLRAERGTKCDIVLRVVEIGAEGGANRPRKR